MERLIAIGDIHGEFRLLVDLVERRIRFDPRNDRLVFLGDYIDRGPKSREVVEYCTALRDGNQGRIILLVGNHEELALNALTRGSEHDLALWLLNGGGATLDSFGGMDRAAESLVPFVRSLDLFWETETHVFVHAGVAADLELPDTPREVLLWSRDFSPHRSGKTVVTGHTRHDRVTFYEGVVAVDTGAVTSGILSGYDVLSGRVYDTGATGAAEKTEP